MLQKAQESMAAAAALSSNGDVILVVSEGQIAEAGTHAQLMERKGVYYKLQKGKKEN